MTSMVNSLILTNSCKTYKNSNGLFWMHGANVLPSDAINDFVTSTLESTSGDICCGFSKNPKYEISSTETAFTNDAQLCSIENIDINTIFFCSKENKATFINCFS